MKIWAQKHGDKQARVFLGDTALYLIDIRKKKTSIYWIENNVEIDFIENDSRTDLEKVIRYVIKFLLLGHLEDHKIAIAEEAPPIESEPYED